MWPSDHPLHSRMTDTRPADRSLYSRIADMWLADRSLYDCIADVRWFTAWPDSRVYTRPMASHHHTDASRMLGISSGSLRRLARAYEANFGELPTDGAGGRLYPDHVLDRIAEVRELVKARRVATIEQAFKLLANGEELATVESPRGLEPVLEEMRLMRLAMERQAEEIAALKEQIRALPAPQATEPPSRPWWRLWGRG
jgi:hypothetical protein